MLDSLLSLLAPHLCCNCQKTGSVLCENCKYDITSEPYECCVLCTTPATNGLCTTCIAPFARAWCVGPRMGGLEAVVDAYKFEGVRSAVLSCGELLDTVLPMLPPETVIVPVPTVPRHIRQRGFDHTLQMAAYLARRRGVRCQQMVTRKTDTVQYTESRADRLRQAKEAFACRGTIDKGAIYLLVDDVITTGATIRYAAEALRQAGAATVWVAAVSRQPIDA